MKLKPTERARRATVILGPDSAKDIDAAIVDVEKAAQESCPGVPANWRGLLRRFQQDLRRVLGDVRRLRTLVSDPESLAELEIECAWWVKACQRKLARVHYKPRRSDAAEKQRAALFARNLLVARGIDPDKRGSRVHELATILYGDIKADLRHYTRPHIVAAVGMTSSPFDFARLRTRGFSQGDKR